MERFYDNLVNRQLLLDQSISRISPASSFLYAVTHIAGTGAPDFIDLIAAIGEYRQAVDRVNKAQNDRNFSWGQISNLPPPTFGPPL